MRGTLLRIETRITDVQRFSSIITSHIIDSEILEQVHQLRLHEHPDRMVQVQPSISAEYMLQTMYNIFEKR